MTNRDYSMRGENAKFATESGLASAQWYHTDLDRKEIKLLMKRSNAPAIRDTIIWLGLMMVFALIAIALTPSWWSLPFWLSYGVLYGSASDSRWHECGHGTAFKTQWMNNVVYHIASFFMIRNPVSWKWSHTRHHTDTIIVGRDPEIAVMRPPVLARVIANFFGIFDSIDGIKAMLSNAAGKISDDVKSYVPETEQAKITGIARIWLAIYLATLIAAIVLQSIIPFLLIGLPRLYGAWHHVMTGLLQHGGLAENVIDHRLNSRTVLMNPISRFIYWNMNYHVEHHMFPMVPYHALPALHEKIKHDLPVATPSIAHGFREMWPALKRQLHNEDYFIKRELPATAKPYREDLHIFVPHN